MAKSPTKLAGKLLEDGPGGMEELRVHLFEDIEDVEESLDDAVMERLYSEFFTDLKQAEAQLTKAYGKPSRIGTEDGEAIPLNGVNRFAIWVVGDHELYLSFAQEDHSLPLLLMLGSI